MDLGLDTFGLGNNWQPSTFINLQTHLQHIKCKLLEKMSVLFSFVWQFLLGSNDLDLNIQNYICVVLANQEQNMSSLGFQEMLKSGCFKVQVQLIVVKGSVVLPCSTDRELGSIDRKSQAHFFLQNFKQVQDRENVQDFI